MNILYWAPTIQGCPHDFTWARGHPRMLTGFYIAHRPSKDDHIILHGPTTIQRWPQNFTWANAIMPIWFYMGHQPSKDAPGFYMDHQPSKMPTEFYIGNRPSKHAHMILLGALTIQEWPQDFTWATDQVDHPRMPKRFAWGTDHPKMLT